MTNSSKSSTTTNNTNPTPRVESVNAKSAEAISQMASTYDADIAKIRSDIRRTRLEINRRYYWKEIEQPGSKSKHKKVNYSTNDLHYLRMILAELQFKLFEAKYNRALLKDGEVVNCIIELCLKGGAYDIAHEESRKPNLELPAVLPQG